MEEIIDFLGEYAETLEAMEQKQIEKLGLLMTRELDKVEQTIICLLYTSPSPRDA